MPFLDIYDLVITATYRGWFLPWRHTSAFRFVTSVDGSGGVHWVSREIPERMQDDVDLAATEALGIIHPGDRFIVHGSEQPRPPDR